MEVMNLSKDDIAIIKMAILYFSKGIDAIEDLSPDGSYEFVEVIADDDDSLIMSDLQAFVNLLKKLAK